MSRVRRLAAAGGGALALLAACSSTDVLEETAPILTNEGVVAQQRNFLLSDLSVGSPGNVRAVNETFDVPVAGFLAEPDPDQPPNPNGSPQGVIRTSGSMEGFGAENTLTYTAGTNEFTFTLDTAEGQFSRTVSDIVLRDPSAVPGVENSRIAKFVLTDPLWFFQPNFGRPVGFAEAFGISDIKALNDVVAIANALTELQQSDNEADNALFLSISTAANNYIDGPDQVLYGYDLPNGNGYVEATNMNSPDPLRETDNVAIISLNEFYDNGGEYRGHMVFGHRTPEPEMPQTGQVVYQGKIVGNVLTNNAVRSLTGGNTVSVDFTTGIVGIEIDSTIREGGNNDGLTTFIPYKDFTGSGTLSDTTFDGQLREVDGDAEGSFQGAFFGPIANEVGGTFLFGDESSYGTGAFTGAQEDDPAN